MLSIVVFVFTLPTKVSFHHYDAGIASREGASTSTEDGLTSPFTTDEGGRGAELEEVVSFINVG